MLKSAIAFFLAGVLTVSVLKSFASPTVNTSYPVVVAKGRLLNQTAPVSTTTIFTPNHDGLYRLSFYGTITQAISGSNAQWWVNTFWTDDGGAQSCQPCLAGGDSFSFPFSQFNFLAGATSTLVEAKAGTPISYDVIQVQGSDGSAYSLYWTVERLE